MSREIVIYGGGDQGRVVCDALQELGEKIVGVVDDIQPDDFPVQWLGPWDKARETHRKSLWHVAIGDNQIRDEILKKVAETVEQAPYTVIHPKAIISPKKVNLGSGSFVAAGAVLAVGVRTGPGALINHGATVDHDCVLGRSVHIAPGCHLAGRVRVKDRALIGVGSAVVPGIQIGEDAVVGAGSTVIRNVDSGLKVAGCPAQSL